MDEMLLLWGKNIRQRREAIDLSTEQLAERLDVKSPTVNRWETGVMEPHRQMKVKIAAALDVDAHDLFPLLET